MEDIDIQRTRERLDALEREHEELHKAWLELAERYAAVVEDRTEAIAMVRRVVDGLGKPGFENVVRDLMIAYGKR